MSHDVGVALLLFMVSLADAAVGAKYITSAAQKRPLRAASWGVLPVLVGAFFVIEYVKNPLMVLPVAAGDWIGTYIAIRHEASV